MPDYKNAAQQTTGVLRDDQPPEQSIEFAARLRAWRLFKDLTQDQLAELSGVSKSSISMAERAFHQNPPKEITQARLASALGITLNDLRTMPTGFEPLIGVVPKGVLSIRSSTHNSRQMSDLALPSKWLLGASDTPEDLNYFMVNDSSMQPTLKVGDIAIIEPSGVTSPGLFLVGMRIGGAITQAGIRRITPAQHNKVKISCDNERFDEKTVQTEDQIALLGKVLFVVRATEIE